MKKRIILALMVIAALALLCGMALADEQGTCGTNLTWSLSGSTLTISGTGDMENYIPDVDVESTTAPWFGKRFDNLVIEEGVTSIGNYAFSYFRSLEEVQFPSSLTRIGDYAFDVCHDLTDVQFPSNLTSIGKEAFDRTGLTEVTIPSGVTSIGGDAFDHCYQLTSVTIEHGVTVISSGMFSNCHNLSRIEIPKTVTEIGVSTFNNCNALADIYFGGSEAEWDSITKRQNWDINAGYNVGGYKVHYGQTNIVTFKVENGAWNDGTTANKTVGATGYDGNAPKLTAKQIPAVGDKPDTHYQAGKWDKTPNTSTAITADTTYTYTYAKPVLTITAKNQTYTYNDQIQGEGDTAYHDPAEIAKRFTVAGLQGSDKITSVNLDGEGIDADVYPLIPYDATVGEATANYNIQYVNGKLTINKKRVTVTALAQKIQEGGKIKTGTDWVTLTGAVPGHSLSAVTLKADDGKITPSAAKIRDAEGNDVTRNYDFTYVPVTVDAPAYSVESGNGQSWKKGNGDLSFTVKRSPDDSKTYGYFESAEVDGKALSSSQMKKAKGSLILTLKASYLKDLKAGTHTLRVQFRDGAAEATFKVQKEMPITGDSANLTLWIACAVIGAAGLGIMALRAKRRSAHN